MKRALALSVFLAVNLSSAEAFAYIGPGAGLSVIGSVFALFGTIGLVIVGFVWYPIKRLRQRLRGNSGLSEQTVEVGKEA